MKRFAQGVGAAALYLCSLTIAQSQELCSRDVMCATAVEHGDAIEFFIENRHPAEITVTLQVETGDGSTVSNTETYPGRQRTKALTVPKGARGSYQFSFQWTWGSLYAQHEDSYRYTLPYAPGQAYRVDQGFNGAFSHSGDFQYAIDWNMPEGTPVHAARAGVVVGVMDGYTKGGANRKYQNFANYVMIKHADGTVAEYAHLQPQSAKVKVGDHVEQGQWIALSGNTGFSSGPHLHFFVYKAVDGGRRQSFPIRFKGHDEIIAGQSYQAS